MNDLEVKTLYESGRAGKWLPVNQVAAELGMSIGRFYASLRRLRETGGLDESRRADLAKRSGIGQAGRRPVNKW